MKNVLSIMVLLLLLSGCGRTEAPSAAPSPSAEPDVSETGIPAPLPTPTQAPAAPLPTAGQTPESTDAVPTGELIAPTEELPNYAEEPDEEAVLAAYRRAAEAWRWFHGGNMPFYGEEHKTVGETLCYRVSYPDITSLDSLRGYLKGLFSDELVDGLMELAENRYLEVDGVLYVRPTEEDADAAGSVEIRQVVRDTSGQLLVRVVAEVPDPEGASGETKHITRDFPYEKVGENWIFTDFSRIR